MPRTLSPRLSRAAPATAQTRPTTREPDSATLTPAEGGQTARRILALLRTPNDALPTGRRVELAVHQLLELAPADLTIAMDALAPSGTTRALILGFPRELLDERPMDMARWLEAAPASAVTERILQLARQGDGSAADVSELVMLLGSLDEARQDRLLYAKDLPLHRWLRHAPASDDTTADAGSGVAGFLHTCATALRYVTTGRLGTRVIRNLVRNATGGITDVEGPAGQIARPEDNQLTARFPSLTMSGVGGTTGAMTAGKIHLDAVDLRAHWATETDPTSAFHLSIGSVRIRSLAVGGERPMTVDQLDLKGLEGTWKAPESRQPLAAGAGSMLWNMALEGVVNTVSLGLLSVASDDDAIVSPRTVSGLVRENFPAHGTASVRLGRISARGIRTPDTEAGAVQLTDLQVVATEEPLSAEWERELAQLAGRPGTEARQKQIAQWQSSVAKADAQRERLLAHRRTGRLAPAYQDHLDELDHLTHTGVLRTRVGDVFVTEVQRGDRYAEEIGLEGLSTRVSGDAVSRTPESVRQRLLDTYARRAGRPVETTRLGDRLELGIERARTVGWRSNEARADQLHLHELRVDARRERSEPPTATVQARAAVLHGLDTSGFDASNLILSDVTAGTQDGENATVTAGDVLCVGGKTALGALDLHLGETELRDLWLRGPWRALTDPARLHATVRQADLDTVTVHKQAVIAPESAETDSVERPAVFGALDSFEGTMRLTTPLQTPIGEVSVTVALPVQDGCIPLDGVRIETDSRVAATLVGAHPLAVARDGSLVLHALGLVPITLAAADAVPGLVADDDCGALRVRPFVETLLGPSDDATANANATTDTSEASPALDTTRTTLKLNGRTPEGGAFDWCGVIAESASLTKPFDVAGTLGGTLRARIQVTTLDGVETGPAAIDRLALRDTKWRRNPDAPPGDKQVFWVGHATATGVTLGGTP